MSLIKQKRVGFFFFLDSLFLLSLDPWLYIEQWTHAYIGVCHNANLPMKREWKKKVKVVMSQCLVCGNVQFIYRHKDKHLNKYNFVYVYIIRTYILDIVVLGFVCVQEKRIYLASWEKDCTSKSRRQSGWIRGGCASQYIYCIFMFFIVFDGSRYTLDVETE